MKIGPFFYSEGRLLMAPIPWQCGEYRLGKYDSSLGHAEWYDELYQSGEYMDIPRGRVIWDKEENSSIIYLDHCIAARKDLIRELIKVFQISRYSLQFDEHYVCSGCVGKVGLE